MNLKTSCKTCVKYGVKPTRNMGNELYTCKIKEIP